MEVRHLGPSQRLSLKQLSRWQHLLPTVLGGVKCTARLQPIRCSTPLGRTHCTPAGVVWCLFRALRTILKRLRVLQPQLAYVISLILRFTSGRSTTKGAFSLGRYSEPIAWVSIAWLAATLTIYVWPSKSPVTATTMNWAIACLAALSESVFGRASSWVGMGVIDRSRSHPCQHLVVCSRAPRLSRSACSQRGRAISYRTPEREKNVPGGTDKHGCIRLRRQPKHRAHVRDTGFGSPSSCRDYQCSCNS